MKRIFDFIDPTKILRILDVGTGSGDFAKLLATLFPGAEITGIDPDEKSLETAISVLTDSKFRFIIMDAGQLVFPDNSFNLVTISNALHHLPDRGTVINEMKRVVTPEGYLVISELYSDNLNPAQEVQKFYHHTRSRVDRLLGIYHHETWSRSEIIQMVREYGVEILGEFDFEKKVNLISNKVDMENWVEKMRQNIERAKGLPDYESLLPLIGEFRDMTQKFGFQPATNVVIIGRK